MKRYRLIKDLPGVKAGQLMSKGEVLGILDVFSLAPDPRDFRDFFEEVVDKDKSGLVICNSCGNEYSLAQGHECQPKKRWEPIRRAEVRSEQSDSSRMFTLLDTTNEVIDRLNEHFGKKEDND